MEVSTIDARIAKLRVERQQYLETVDDKIRQLKEQRSKLAPPPLGPNRGGVTPASQEKLEREIAELRASGEKPAKLTALLAVLKDSYGVEG